MYELDLWSDKSDAGHHFFRLITLTHRGWNLIWNLKSFFPNSFWLNDKREQRTQLSMIDSRLERATQRLESLSSQQSGLTPADLIERTSDELKTANYRKKELLPKTLQGKALSFILIVLTPTF